MLVLHHNDMSTASQRVRFVLAEKALDWESVAVDIRAGEQHRPEFLAINPSGMVPVLVHDGTPIAESGVITEYLEDAFPEPALRPSDPLACARMRGWTVQIDDSLQPMIGVLSFAIAFRHGLVGRPLREIEESFARMPDPVKRQRQREAVLQGLDTPLIGVALRRFRRLLDDMEKVLGQADWVAGGFGLADIGLAPYVARLDHLELGWLWEDRPAVGRWYARLQERDGYRVSHTERFVPRQVEFMREQGRAAAARLRALAG